MPFANPSRSHSAVLQLVFCWASGAAWLRRLLERSCWPRQVRCCCCWWLSGHWPAMRLQSLRMSCTCPTSTRASVLPSTRRLHRCALSSLASCCWCCLRLDLCSIRQAKGAISQHAESLARPGMANLPAPWHHEVIDYYPSISRAHVNAPQNLIVHGCTKLLHCLRSHMVSNQARSTQEVILLILGSQIG